jgi:hypothetical protein
MLIEVPILVMEAEIKSALAEGDGPTLRERRPNFAKASMGRADLLITCCILHFHFCFPFLVLFFDLPRTIARQKGLAPGQLHGATSEEPRARLPRESG